MTQTLRSGAGVFAVSSLITVRLPEALSHRESSMACLQCVKRP